MDVDVVKTIQIKLNPTDAQIDEVNKLFAAFKEGMNFSLRQIEATYQAAMKKYSRIREKEGVEGLCGGCGKERKLFYSSGHTLFCTSCVMREYSEYSIAKTIIGTRQRKVGDVLPVLKNGASCFHELLLHTLHRR